MRNLTGPLIGPVLILIAALSWSTAGLFTRVVTTDIPTTLLWRSLFGGVCVLVIYILYNREFDPKKIFRFSAGECVIAALSTAGMICFISAFFFTSIANVSFVYGVMPLVTYALSLLFLREKLSARALTCCLLSTSGVLIVTYGNSGTSDYIGIALALGMTFFMAALTVAAKFFPDADSMKATWLSAFLGAIAVAPFSAYTTVPLQDYIWLGGYGLVNVGLGFGVYLLGVNRVSALVAALVGLLEIPLAPVWAWLLFSEESSAVVIVGGIIILAAAVLYITRPEITKRNP